MLLLTLPIQSMVGRPLYRGRELKFLRIFLVAMAFRRPLYRGRELKYHQLAWALKRAYVALCIGGVS